MVVIINQLEVGYGGLFWKRDPMASCSIVINFNIFKYYETCKVLGRV